MNNNDDISKSLQQELKEKRVQNSQWASYEYNLARLFALLATVGSFATSWAALSDMVPKPIIAVMASVPGTAIILDKSLAPFARHRWHAKVIVHLEYFENQLKYEKVAPSIINKKDSEFMIQIEDCYPSISIGNRNDIPDQNKLKLPDEDKNQN